MTNPAKADWEDDNEIKELVELYSDRYGQAFWEPFLELVGDSPRRTIADFGCGPGLFLADAAKKFQAEEIYGLDESSRMLQTATLVLTGEVDVEKISLRQLDFDFQKIEIQSRSIELAFSGYLLHELMNPLNLLEQIVKVLDENGLYAVYDFISGDEQAFVNRMTNLGWSEKRAHEKYPSMCKHSLEDLKHLLQDAGFTILGSKTINNVLGIIIGEREKS
ncbi:MAG: methyltransferase domain-containing protein [Candidatus Lokiarchaeota archaeon]|nr:methyltransferase domain-containing protein [Candidatus Lokiarchaeota archaeon]